MGGGHDGAAHELARRLDSAGYRAPILDLLGTMRFGYGRLLTGIYRFQVAHAMWSYNAVYRSWRTGSSLASTANRTDTAMARRGLLTAITRHHPIAIISVYNLASQVLGELTRRGELSVPFFTFLTDFGVHPYWVHPATAGYFTVHDHVVVELGSITDAPITVTGPFVASAFPAAPNLRGATRRSLGLDPSVTVPLVVAGAWGVGDVAATVADLVDTGGPRGVVPVVVCGRNRRLASRLRRRLAGRARVLGHVDTMPELMQAADLLVENAGGLTTMEAFTSRLPVVTYRPIAAHGTDNAHAMADAGVTRFAHDPDELVGLVSLLAIDGPARRRLVHAGAATIRPDAVHRLVDVVDPDRHVVSAPPSRLRSAIASWPRAS